MVEIKFELDGITTEFDEVLTVDGVGIWTDVVLGTVKIVIYIFMLCSIVELTLIHMIDFYFTNEYPVNHWIKF